MSAQPGSDELRIRTILRKRGVGPDAELPDADHQPHPDPDDWWDELYADDDPEPEDDSHEPEEEPPAKTPPTRPAPAQPRAPRQSLTDAFDKIPARTRWLLYHATAAATGWRLGLVDWATHTAAWYTAGHWTTPSAFVLYGLGVCAICLYRRTRGWVWPAAWAAAIPVSSTAVGILLYGTTT